MKRFATQGRVYPGQRCSVSRTEELTDFISCIEEGRCWNEGLVG